LLISTELQINRSENDYSELISPDQDANANINDNMSNVTNIKEPEKPIGKSQSDDLDFWLSGSANTNSDQKNEATNNENEHTEIIKEKSSKKSSSKKTKDSEEVDEKKSKKSKKSSKNSADNDLSSLCVVSAIEGANGGTLLSSSSSTSLSSYKSLASNKNLKLVSFTF
jgi:hypothetical protein